MANVKISKLKEQRSPDPTSATLVGVDNGETVQIPISYFQQNLSDDVVNLTDDQSIYGKKGFVEGIGTRDIQLGDEGYICADADDNVEITSGGDTLRIMQETADGVLTANEIILTRSGGMRLDSIKGIKIGATEVDSPYGMSTGINGTKLYDITQIYTNNEGDPYMPSGAILASNGNHVFWSKPSSSGVLVSNGTDVTWSNDYVHGDTFYDELLNYAAKEHTHEEYLTGDTIFDVDGVATEKYVDDEISATLGTILATLNRI